MILLQPVMLKLQLLMCKLSISSNSLPSNQTSTLLPKFRPATALINNGSRHSHAKCFFHNRLSLLWMLCVFLLTACSTTPIQTVGLDKPGPPKAVELNALYINQALNFEIDFDSSWHFSSEESLIKNHSTNGKLLINSQAEDDQIATFSRFPPDKPSQFNDNLTITSEPIERYPSVSSADDYLKLLRTSLRRNQAGATFQNLYQTQVGERTFTVLPMNFNVYGIKIYQSHYAIIHQEKIIDFILTYAVRNREQDLVAMLSSLRFTLPEEAVHSISADN